MYQNYNSFFFIPMLISYLLMTASNSPLVMWIFMEIGSVLFVMMLAKQTPDHEFKMTMFLIQGIASSIMLFGIMTNLKASTFILNIGILLKLGMFPFHPWLIKASVQVEWPQLWIILSIQKIPPLVMMQGSTNMIPLMWSITLGSLFVTFKGLFTSNPKIMLTYSSIIQSGWMMMSMMADFIVWAIYCTIYILTLNMFCSIIWKTSPKSPNKPSKVSKMINLTALIALSLIMMIPPTSLFTMKVMIISYTSKQILITMTSLALSSAVSLIFYVRMMVKIIFSKTLDNKIPSNLPKFNASLIILFILMTSIIASV